MDRKPNIAELRLDTARFGLRGPRDLLQKLQRDYQRLKSEDEVGHDHVAFIAFDCAVAAWSILEWTYHAIDRNSRSRFGISSTDDQRAVRQFERHLVEQRQMKRLPICHDLATGAKHFYVDSSRISGKLHTGVVQSGRIGTIGPDAGKRINSYWPIIHFGDAPEFADDFFANIWLQWSLFLDEEKIDVRNP